MTSDMDIYKLPVFEPADEFPMMPDTDLDALAADIKANGLHQPIIVAMIGDLPKTKLMTVDGRNRLAACKIAGIKADEIPVHTCSPN